MVIKLIELSKVGGDDDEVIIDVGANLGEYTQKLFITFPNLHYILFEPQKEIFELSRKKS